MMDHLLAAAIVFLLANLALGLWRIWRGPTTADRMLSALLFGATSVAVLILMAEWQAIPALRIVALLLVMLAAIITITYAGISRASGPSDQPGGQQR